MKKILIFTSLTGGGHVSLAEALSDVLCRDHEVMILDPQPRLVHWHYRMVSRHALWLWKAEYRMSQGRRRAALAHRVSSRAFARRVTGALQRAKPDLVITTYPFLTSEVAFAMQRSALQRPFIMLFTDPDHIHDSWLTEKRASLTFAPTKETYRQALEAGFDPSHLHFTGWPVRRQFHQAEPGRRKGVLSDLGLEPDKFTVFAQGGGEGAARFAGMITRLAELPGVQIIMAAGTNEALLRRFHGFPNIHGLPFTRQIAPYMSAADLVMGKAGPNMLFETVTLGKPFVATAYIPGQEEANLQFINRHGLGWVALHEREQRALIHSLMRDPQKRAGMSASVERYREMNTAAAQQIPGLVDALLEGATLRAGGG